MIDKLVTLALFPLYTTMRIIGVVTHDSLELLEEIGILT